MSNLRVEYLLTTKKSSKFCNSVKTFNNLLAANADIQVKPAKLRYKSLEVEYNVYTSELVDKDLRFFHLRFVCVETDRIDEFDELLKAVRTIAYKTEGQIKMLWDDIAFHYSVKSYPLINEVENLMRRLIIQFMITTVGIDWDKEALPKDLKDSVKRKKGVDSSVTSILHETDFIQLADALFKPYFTKDIDLLYKQIDRIQDTSELDLAELQHFVPKSNWSRYFSPLVDCDDGFLSKRWNELYDLRCLVAHNNLLRKQDYERIITLVNEVTPKLQKAISSLDKVTVPEQEKDNLAENIVVNISNLYGEFIHWWRLLELELIRLSASYLPKERSNRLTTRLMTDMLRSRNIIDDELAKQVSSLSYTRNLIVHGGQTLFGQEDPGDINQQIGLLKDVVVKLKSL